MATNASFREWVRASSSVPAPRRTRLAVCAAVAVLAGLAPASAQSLGPEILVNTTTAGEQKSPDVAVKPSGDFVVVWTDMVGDQDVPDAIRAQQVSRSGALSGPEFVVAQGEYYQRSQLADHARVSSDASGGFIVSYWRQTYSFCECAIETLFYDVVGGKRYASDGTYLGSNGPTALHASPGGLASGPAGQSVVSWSNQGGYCCFYQSCYDCRGDSPGPAARIRTTGGTFLDLQLDTKPASSQSEVSVGMDTAGNVVVAWQESSDGGAWAQLFASDGTARGPSFRLNSQGTAGIPQVAMGSAGGFVATWSNGGVYARKFLPDGTALGLETLVSAGGAEPAVAVGPSGQYAIAYSAPAGGNLEVFVQHYDNQGGAVGTPLRMNATTAGAQSSPRIGYDNEGTLTAVWKSDGQDGDAGAIVARRLDATGMEKLHTGVGPGPTTANPPISAQSTFDASTGKYTTVVYGGAVRHYGTLTAGVNVGGADMTPAIAGEFLTGPGSVAVYGPHVRGWAPGGVPIAKVSFYAYGTLRYGVKARGSQADADVLDEILTGAGEGLVFGPHVRGFNFDGGTLSALARINFFAYDPGQYRYGVNLEAGDLDGDGSDELATGPAVGAGYPSWLKAWQASATAGVLMLAELPSVFLSPASHGITVGTGDLDGDARAEVLCGHGPGPSLDARIHGVAYGAGSLSLIAGIDTVAFPTSYGVNVAGADLDGDRLAEVYAASGPDSAAAALLRGFSWPGPGLDLAPMTGLWDVAPFGTTAPAATHGATLGRGVR